jgi:hypothetical protein
MGSIRWRLGILYCDKARDRSQFRGYGNFIMAQFDAVKPQTDYCLTGILFDIGDFAQDLNATTYHSPLERKLLSYSRYNRLAYATLLRIDRVLQFHRDDSAGRDRVLGVQTPLESKEIKIAEKGDATN